MSESPSVTVDIPPSSVPPNDQSLTFEPVDWKSYVIRIFLFMTTAFTGVTIGFLIGYILPYKYIEYPFESYIVVSNTVYDGNITTTFVKDNPPVFFDYTTYCGDVTCVDDILATYVPYTLEPVYYVDDKPTLIYPGKRKDPAAFNITKTTVIILIIIDLCLLITFFFVYKNYKYPFIIYR